MAKRRQGDPAKALAYLRVSTGEQKLGPEAQRAAIERWAEAEGVTIVAWHVDVGVSGGAALDQRPALASALVDLRDHTAGVLVVAVRDRLARDVEQVVAIEREVRAAGAVIVQADGVGNGTDPAARFMRRIDDARSEYERALIRARTKAALAVKRARGERAGECPFGMRVALDGRTLEADPAEKAIIASVRDLRCRGMSIRRIASALAKQGLCSPRSGKPLSPTQVHRIVRRHDAEGEAAA